MRHIPELGTGIPRLTRPGSGKSPSPFPPSLGSVAQRQERRIVRVAVRGFDSRLIHVGVGKPRGG
jgi:hypothetical protein